MRYPSEERWLIETLNEADGWTNFVVFILFGSHIRRVHLAHNGQRFARSSGLWELCDRFPALAEQIAAWAEQR